MTPIIIDDDAGNWVMAEHIVGVFWKEDDQQTTIHTLSTVHFYSKFSPAELIEKINPTEEAEVEVDTETETKVCKPVKGDVMRHNMSGDKYCNVLVSEKQSGIVIESNIEDTPVGTHNDDWTWPNTYWTNLGPKV